MHCNSLLLFAVCAVVAVATAGTFIFLVFTVRLHCVLKPIREIPQGNYTLIAFFSLFLFISTKRPINRAPRKWYEHSNVSIHQFGRTEASSKNLLQYFIGLLQCTSFMLYMLLVSQVISFKWGYALSVYLSPSFLPFATCIC